MRKAEPVLLVSLLIGKRFREAQVSKIFHQ
jgi:hypothetical protein